MAQRQLTPYPIAHNGIINKNAYHGLDRNNLEYIVYQQGKDWRCACISPGLTDDSFVIDKDPQVAFNTLADTMEAKWNAQQTMPG